MHPIFVGIFASTWLAATTLAQCPAGTQPTQLPVYGWTGNPVGSTHMAVDEGIIVSDYSWPNSGYPIPFVQVHRLGPTGWHQTGSFSAFKAVVGLAVNGNTIAWTTPVEHYESSVYPAEVLVFIEDPANPGWNLAGTLIAPDTTQTQFGRGIALGASGTTQTLVFGTVHPSDLSEVVYVYSLDSAAVPTLAQTIPDPEPSNDHSFGRHMAIDGDLLAVGAIGDDQAGPNAGAVYIFRLLVGSWTQVQKIVPDTTTTSAHFGQSLALNGGRLIVGAVHSEVADGDVPAGQNFANGFARIYVWNGASFDLESQFINPNNTSPDHTGFGGSVAIHGDRALVGALQDNVFGPTAGAAYLYQRIGAAWQPRGGLGLPNGGGGWFGTAVGLTSDYAFANAPLYNQGQLAVAVFDHCALPPMPGEPSRCTPGLSGLVSYIINWFQLDPIADFNQDGAVGIVDLFAFLNAWMAGCP